MAKAASLLILSHSHHARRNHPGDRAKALKAILPIVESGGKVASDVYCLCGRIYKDMFMSSGFTDHSSRDQACYWYYQFACVFVGLLMQTSKRAVVSFYVRAHFVTTCLCNSFFFFFYDC